MLIHRLVMAAMSSLPFSTAGALINELLQGMRLSGVQFRKIAVPAAQGVGFSNAAGRAQFHFVSRGPVWLRSPRGAMHALNTGEALLIPQGGSHAILSGEKLSPDAVKAFRIKEIAADEPPDDTAKASVGGVIYSACMEFYLGGMQPLIAAMPEVMRVSNLFDHSPELGPMLTAMERESMMEQAGSAGVLARLAEVVAALIVREWAAKGCGNATGWVRALSDPRLSRAIVMMHKAPGRNWTVAELAKEAGQSRSVFSRRFMAATQISPLRYLTELRMRLALHSLTHENHSVDAVAGQLGYGSLAAFSRAFKRMTGVSPGAVRSLTQTGAHPSVNVRFPGDG